MNKKLFNKLNKTRITGTTLEDIAKREFASTGIPFFDLALGGRLDSGLTHGWNFIAAPSKHFKTSLLLQAMAGWQRENPDGLVVFYDSESGSSDLTYFKNYGVNIDNVLHVPITNIEEWNADFIQKLEAIENTDKVLFAIDSVGNTPSRKELENAKSNNDKQDMTRAKALKSLTRMVTPYLNAKRIPVVAVNHVYETQEMYSKTVMSGGTGVTLSANTVIFITRSEITNGKKGKDKVILGYTFTLVIDKSRTIKEKSKFPISVGYDEGIDKYSSVFEHALKFGFIKCPAKGWYEYKGQKMRRSAIDENTQIYDEILADKDFQLLVEGFYTLDMEIKHKAAELAKTRNVDIEESLVKDEDDENAEEFEVLEDDEND